MRAKAIVFSYTTPPGINECRSLVLRADAVFPMIGICKAAAGPSQVRNFEFLQRFDDVIPDSVCIRNLLISLAHIETTIDTLPEVFRKMPVNVAIDLAALQVGVENDAVLCQGTDT